MWGELPEWAPGRTSCSMGRLDSLDCDQNESTVETSTAINAIKLGRNIKK